METRFDAADRDKYVGKLRNTSAKITGINEGQEERAHIYHTRAQTLTICYLLYQIILTTSSTVGCQHWWVPLTLALIPAILYFAALHGALTGYDQTKRQLDMYCIELQRIRARIHEAESRNDAVLRIDCDDGHVMKPDGFVEFKRAVCIWTTVMAVVGFTAVVLAAPRCLLCRR